MSAGQVIILSGERSRAAARTIVDCAPEGSLMQVSAPRRTLPQNDKMHAMLSDVARSKPPEEYAFT